jgi:type IV conjugative transfer system protein TraL
MSANRHLILNHVDSPLKILFWTKGELSLLATPFSLGVMLDEFVVGIFMAFLSGWVSSQYKKKFGRGKIQTVIYWYLPSYKKLHGIPPSFIREYLG